MRLKGPARRLFGGPARRTFGGFTRLWRGWTQEKIAEVVGLSRNRISEIVGNTNFGNIDTLLSQGHDMEYIARHYHMDLAQARPPRLRRCRWRAGLGFKIGREKGISTYCFW